MVLPLPELILHVQLRIDQLDFSHTELQALNQELADMPSLSSDIDAAADAAAMVAQTEATASDRTIAALQDELAQLDQTAAAAAARLELARAGMTDLQHDAVAAIEGSGATAAAAVDRRIKQDQAVLQREIAATIAATELARIQHDIDTVRNRYVQQV